MRSALLLAVPLMVCKTGIHVPEGGGKPVRQKFVRADKEDNKGEPAPAQSPDEPPAKPELEPKPRPKPKPKLVQKPPAPVAKPPPAKKPPPRIAKRPDPPKPPPKKPRPKKIAPPVRPSPHLCGNVSPELTNPRPMSSDERKPLTATVDANIGEIRACYEEARVRAKVDGCMFAVFTVDSSGQLKQPYIDTSNIPDSAMQTCVTDAIGAMDLRASVDNVVWKVLYPFFFERGEIFHSSQHKRATG